MLVAIYYGCGGKTKTTQNKLSHSFAALYTYYKHTYEVTSHNGKVDLTVRYLDQKEPYKYAYSNWKHVATEELTTSKQYLYLDTGILLFGKYYQVSEEHTGTYVIDKAVWEEATKDFDQSIKSLAEAPDPDYYPFEEVEPEELDNLVVVDFGGQLECCSEGYFHAIDEAEDLPQLPLDSCGDYSDVGNG